MIIPHLHLGGNCKEAIELYERAFDTKKPSDIRTLLEKKGDITSSDERRSLLD
jgi:uncharacterized glyoxalase superfamily protein PhnB